MRSENADVQFQPVIGIDLGGTQIRAAILQRERILARAATLTGAKSLRASQCDPLDQVTL